MGLLDLIGKILSKEEQEQVQKRWNFLNGCKENEVIYEDC